MDEGYHGPSLLAKKECAVPHQADDSPTWWANDKGFRFLLPSSIAIFLDALSMQATVLECGLSSAEVLCTVYQCLRGNRGRDGPRHDRYKCSITIRQGWIGDDKAEENHIRRL